jgi:anaerobic magnesium-protoporphyrin IX monomethyl ester cyclase
MKILFVDPPANFLPVCNGFYFPKPATLSLAAYLLAHRHKVKIIEPFIMRLNYKDITRIIKDEDPDIIVISGFTYIAYNCMAMAKLIKEVLPAVKIIAGGMHFSYMPQESFAICKDIDYIIIGEGELSILELINELESGKDKSQMGDVKGLAYMLADKLVKTAPRPLMEDIDSLPMPAYHLLPLNKMHRWPLVIKGRLGCTFSRGCIHRCKFCSSSNYWGRTVRRRSAVNIVNELELLVNKYNQKMFLFGDDDFLYDRAKSIEFIDELEARRLKIKFGIKTRVNDIIKNKDLLDRFRRSGLISVGLGIERFQDSDLQAWDKDYQAKDVKVALDYIRQAGIPLVEMYLIFGCPGDNMATWKVMLKNIKKLREAVFYASFITPFPGSRIAEELNGQIQVWDYRQYDFSHAIIPTQSLSVPQLNALVGRGSFLWWLNPYVFLRCLQNRYRLQFYLNRLIMHMRGIWKFFIYMIKERSNEKDDKFILLVEEYHKRHLQYIGKQDSFKGPLIIRERWGFRI